MPPHFQKPAGYDDVMAQYIGLVAFRGDGVGALAAAHDAAVADEKAGRPPFGGVRSLDRLYMTDLLQGLIARQVPLSAVPVDRGWVEVDSVKDLAIAQAIAQTGALATAA